MSLKEDAATVGGAITDVSDRALRLLGVVTLGVGSVIGLSPGAAVDVTDRAARLLGHVTVDNFPATVDVSDRVGRLLGHTIIDSATILALTDGTQRLGGTVDVSDRAARLLGHVAVDSATIAALTDSTLRVGGTVDIGDRVGRLLGVIANLPAALVGGRLDVNVGASIAQDVSDRAARLLGVVTAAALTDGTQRNKSADLMVTALSGANAAVTLTLPAAGVGLFHHITSVEIVRFNPTVTAVAAAATELTVTSTNLPGTPAWSSGTLLAAGARETLLNLLFGVPLKSLVANTATTIVAPAYGAGTKARINVTYYTGA